MCALDSRTGALRSENSAGDNEAGRGTREFGATMRLASLKLDGDMDNWLMGNLCLSTPLDLGLVMTTSDGIGARGGSLLRLKKGGKTNRRSHRARRRHLSVRAEVSGDLVE